MVKSSRGRKHGTRHRFKRGMREKFTIEPMMNTFKVGEAVIITSYAADQSGFPHIRHVGKTGTVTGMRGNHYLIATKEGNKKKILILGSQHLRRK